MQDADARHRHHPALLIRALAALAALLLAPAASAGNLASLPSPTAPLSVAPPLAGGAGASAEAVRHRVTSHVSVTVSVDRSGTPFAVSASQRLDVRVAGDYFFTIGAPVLDVRALPGSQATPGFRTGAIVWEGFDPGRRILGARAVLDPVQVAPMLPLRIEVGKGMVTLVNATGVTASAYDAEAQSAQLLRFLAGLRAAVRAHALPLGGNAEVTTKPRPVRIAVSAPLRVSGTIGTRHVSLLLRSRAVVHATGPVRLTVEPVELVPAATSALGGRALLRLASAASLTLARTRQYEMFVGNPDPTGRSETSYTYRTSARPTAAPVAVVTHRSSSYWWAWTIGLLALAFAAVAVWARS